MVEKCEASEVINAGDFVRFTAKSEGDAFIDMRTVTKCEYGMADGVCLNNGLKGNWVSVTLFPKAQDEAKFRFETVITGSDCDTISCWMNNGWSVFATHVIDKKKDDGRAGYALMVVMTRGAK